MDITLQAKDKKVISINMVKTSKMYDKKENLKLFQVKMLI